MPLYLVKFIRLIIMTKYMKYDNMIIIIYFDNQTKCFLEIKKENRKSSKEIWEFKNNKCKRRRERNLNDSRTKV